METCAIFPSLRVRKLTGKPAFLTIADCESEARRIQIQTASFKATESRALRIHSDFPAINQHEIMERTSVGNDDVRAHLLRYAAETFQV